MCEKLARTHGSPQFSAQMVRELFKPVKHLVNVGRSATDKRLLSICKFYRLPPNKENPGTWLLFIGSDKTASVVV